MQVIKRATIIRRRRHYLLLVQMGSDRIFLPGITIRLQLNMRTQNAYLTILANIQQWRYFNVKTPLNVKGFTCYLIFFGRDPTVLSDVVNVS